MGMHSSRVSTGSGASLLARESSSVTTFSVEYAAKHFRETFSSSAAYIAVYLELARAKNYPFLFPWSGE